MATKINSQLDLDASYYVQNSSLQNNLAKQIIDKHQFSQNAHILDIGCGDGRITAELARHAIHGKVLGIDASASMIDFATKNFAKEHFPNLDFIHSTAEDIELPEQYDLVASFSCFHWLKDPPAVLQKLSSILKPGGELLILTYPKESPYYKYLELALEDYPEFIPLSANNNMLSCREYKQILGENKFEILDFEENYLSAIYFNAEEIEQYIKGWLNTYVQLPKDLSDQYLNKVSQIMLNDSSIHSEGKISVPYIALIIKARKL